MLFNSIEFLFFFPIVVGITLLIQGRFRWYFLLGASYFFYMSWRVEYIVLILLSTVIDYWVTGHLSKTTDARRRKLYLLVSICVNLGLLFYFKYLIFVVESANSVFAIIGADGRINTPSLILPVGISFYTFQTLAYTIDVYRGHVEREDNFIIFALFVSYFPQLVAGPIERSKNLLPQLKQLAYKNLWNSDRIADGLRLISWGMFKKVAVADRLALYVNPIYTNPESYTGVSIVLATVFFAFQIYCDFSGYSDIAIGSAKIIGVDLSLNFWSPYFSKSIPEFWERWHISLSTWFRDYVYIPLGGNRVTTPRWMLNIIVVFFVSGLWHGASWTFAIWGLIHGGFYLVYFYGQKVFSFPRKLSPVLSSVVRVYQTLLLFIVVCFGWIFFRANSFSDVLILLENMVTLEGNWKSINVAAGKINIIAGLLGIITVIVVDLVLVFVPSTILSSQRLNLVRLVSYILLLFSIMIFGAFQSNQEFVYFQF